MAKARMSFKRLLFSTLWLATTAAVALDDALISPSDQMVSTDHAKLNYLEIHQRARQTTLVLRLQNTVQPSIFALKHPNRLIIDLPATALSKAMPKQIQDTGLIQQIRLGTGPEGNGNLRLVLDLAQACQYASLIDDLPDQHQQVITLILTCDTPAAALPATQEPSDLSALQGSDSTLVLNKAKAIKTPKAIAIHTSSARAVNIVIDPGHGGKDSGAVGANGLQEKTVVLAISQRLVALLNQQPGIHAQLTRKGDYFLSLRERLHLARTYKADLFMAIHADAFNNDTASGASVFALSAHGATSEAARWLAERENVSEFAGLPFKQTDYQLKSVLLDMAQTATIQDSLSWGKELLQQLTTITPLHTNRVEQAGFVVLKSPDIPSVLVETGFVSNSKEAALLASNAYQNKMAQALMAGIVDYCQRNPPADSYFEMHYKKASN